MKRREILILFFLVVFCMADPARAREFSSQKLKCHVVVSQVLEAKVNRGPPYLVQMLQNNTKHAEFITRESHGDHHLACTYKILLNSQPYRYKSELPNTLLKLQENDCDGRRVKREVRAQVLRLTDQCQNPLARPARGHPLEPLADGR